MHYKNNYLTQVILRLDFPLVEALREHQPSLSARIKEHFPNVVARTVTNVTLVMGPNGPSLEQQAKGIWEHRDSNDGKKMVAVSADYLTFEYVYPAYSHYPAFKQEFDFIYAQFQNDQHVPQFSRIGLRYVNEVTLPTGNALDWDGLINADLVTSVKAGLSGNHRLLRSMHQLETKCDDVNVLTNYGIHNPDYPTPVARRQFILDFDCSVSNVADNEVLASINKLNNVAETMFENSIEQGLRNIMGVIDG